MVVDEKIVHLSQLLTFLRPKK